MTLPTGDDWAYLLGKGLSEARQRGKSPDMTMREFVKTYLPTLSLERHHLEAMEFLDSNPLALWRCPVGHGKSTLVTFILPLYTLAYNREERILICTKALDRSHERVRRLRSELEHNRDLIGSFGEFRCDDTWTDHRLFVKRRSNLQDPSVTASGMGGSIEGIRVTRAILDDVIDIESMTSELTRERSKEWYLNTLKPRLEPHGRVNVIGTPWHPDDLYAFLSTLKGWQALTHKAVTTDDKGAEAALWPSRFSLDDLLTLRGELGEMVFQARYQCNPKAIEGNVFKAQWLQFYEETPAKFERIVQGWDLAISEKALADYTVGITIGVLQGVWYILDILRTKADFPTTLNLIKQKAYQFKPESVAIETVGYQMAVVQELRRTTGLPIVDQGVSGDKVARLMGLGVDFETGRFRLRREMNDFVNEYLEFPNGKHDDMLDALWHCRERLRWKMPEKWDIDIDSIM